MVLKHNVYSVSIYFIFMPAKITYMNEYEGGKREGVTPRPEIQSFFSEGTS
jgi:hypothetical protein